MPNRKQKPLRQIMAENLRVLSLAAHISQEELSFRCGLSKNYISDVERGTRNISLKAISKLAYGLHVEIKDLFTFPK